MTKKSILITGTSKGIGKETAKLFIQNNWKVYATARNINDLSDLENLGCEVLELDVTNEKSILQALSKIDQLDVLVNNAAFAPLGDIETFDINVLRKMYETNIIGLVRVTQLVLPIMRPKKQGRIINISSGGGEFTSPFSGFYHSTKYALESISDALRFEAGIFGIKVIVIQPSPVLTDLAKDATSTFNITESNSYKNYILGLIKTANKAYKNKTGYVTPQKVAETIYKAASTNHPKARYKVGIVARILPFLRKYLPISLWDGIWKLSIKPLN